MRPSRGQSATELAIALPIVLGLLFAVVELGFWFGGTHYANYAAFAGARAQQVGGNPEAAVSALLDGRATRDATARADGSAVRVDMPWEADLPFVSGIGDLSYDVTVVAGPDEEGYEGLSGDRAGRYGDNNCRGRC
ncbi:MAG: pilus assembly protein [Deltaproteobacteria bacterium]|nr:pilus assembly protein [Deltaproteobacteria bacterium]